MRRGYTLIEIAVASLVGVTVLAGVIGLFMATRRMSNAGELSGAMAEASMAMETIHRDLIQGVQKPGKPYDRVVYVSKEAAQFLRGERRADGTLVAQLVVYRRAPLGNGYFKLMRKIGANEGPLPGTYAHAVFESFKGTGGPFVRVTLHVAARNAPPAGAAQGSDEATLTSLMRVAGPEMLETDLYRFKCMDELKSVELLSGTLGF